MPSATINANIQVGGQVYQTSYTATDEVLFQASVTAPAAQSGTLGTRSSDTAGTATLSEGHTITTGMLVDIVWTGGYARNATVGTVSGTSVPFTGLTGDVLPTQATAISVCPVVEIPLSVDPDNAALEVFQAGGAGQIAFRTSDAEAYVFKPTTTSMWSWDSSQVAANPLGSTALASIQVSTSAATATAYTFAILSSVQ
jgi:hypothetical protein